MTSLAILAMLVCRGGWALALAILATSASAQTSDEMASFRQEIAQRRVVVEDAHARSRVECYQRFAVNDCLLAAKRLRGEQMGDLRRQDIALNDLERKRKSAEQVRKMEARQVDSTVQQAQTQRAEAVQQKQQTQVARVAKPPPVPKPPNRPAVVQPGRSAAERAEAASAFEQRQQAAQERQAEVQKARAKRSKPLAEPLPSRGATPTPLQSELTGQP